MASDQTVSGKPPSKLPDLPAGRHQRPCGTRYFDSGDGTNDRLPSPEPDKAGSGKSLFVPSGVIAKLAAYRVMTSTAFATRLISSPSFVRSMFRGGFIRRLPGGEAVKRQNTQAFHCCIPH